MLVLAWLLVFIPVSQGALQAPPLRGNITAHDPGTIIKCKDKYYLFYTGFNIPSKSSTDKTFWSGGPPVFTSAPNWTTNLVPGFAGTFWAPDILYLNGRFCLYYAVSTFGSQVSAIGLATNPTLDPADPIYHWTDQGMVIASTNGSPYNTIDPSMTFDTSGNLWMSFGSYWNGIYIVQLNALTGGRIAANSPTYHEAYNSSIEASYLFQRGGYYYLFANWGSCCSGVNSTYNIRVGRSLNVTGPYLDRNGADMAGNGGSLFLQGTGKFTGPGHMAILSENGRQWFSYHYYDAGAYAPWYGAYGVSDFDVEPLAWTADNWPYFTNDWSAIYNFQADARDDNGQYYGLLANGASVQPAPLHRRVLNLNGVNQYVELPPGVAFARTFAMVVKWNGGAPAQRLFDFGVDTNQYFMLTPSSATDNKLRCDIRASDLTESVTTTAPLPTNVWTHVALTLTGQTGTIYVNGVAAGAASVILSPLDVLSQTNTLGRSKFATQPYFNGQFASFRVYGRALSPAEITATQPVIAQPADGSMYWPGTTISFNGSAQDFASNPLTAAQLSWQVQYVQDDSTNTVYQISGVTNGAFSIPTNATGGGTYQILLTAVDGAGHSGTFLAHLIPANPPAGWSSYYPLQQDANDLNGHYNGVLNGGAAFQNDATRGSVLALSGTNQFVSLPPGAAGMQTFMAWVNWNGGAAWQRIFDFGNNETNYAFLTPSAANGKLRFAISLNSQAGEEIVDAPAALPVGVWTHVAVTLDGQSGIVYTNGVPVATNKYVGLVPGALGFTNNYLGKSQYPDPYFNGQLSSMRIVSRALSAAEIVAPMPVINGPAPGSCYHPGDTIAFSGNATDFYNAPLPASNLTWQVQWWNASLTNNLLGSSSGITNRSFTVPTFGSESTNGAIRITLTAVDVSGRCGTNYVDIFPIASALTNASWSSYYPFTANANDASNHFNGLLLNGASIQTDSTRGPVLNLSGANQYVALPAGVNSAQTISAWVNWRGGNSWQQIFDFGGNTQQYFFLTPCADDGNLQCCITAEAANYQQLIEAPVLPTNTWTQVAVTMDGREGILYVNGQAVGVNNSVNLLPSDLVGTSSSFGRSQFLNDPYFNGEISALKLNSQALSLRQITAPTALITQPSPGSFYAGGETINYAGLAADDAEQLLAPSNYTWSAEFHHDGLTDLVQPPTFGATNGSLSISTNAPLSTNVFYRFNLTVTDTNGNQQATSVDVLPQTSRLNFTTVPAGLPVGFDGETLTTPTNVVTVTGMNRTLSVLTPQSLGGTNYNFVVWSDGGAISHFFWVPTNNASITASFLPPALNLLVGVDTLSLQWPAWSGIFSLWSATNLSPPINWNLVTNAPQTTNGFLSLNLPMTNASTYYRLQFP